ncbi:hypothetical protein Plhal304r1_c011g0041911 [Plasmopara halstedii]
MPLTNKQIFALYLPRIKGVSAHFPLMCEDRPCDNFVLLSATVIAVPSIRIDK